MTKNKEQNRKSITFASVMLIVGLIALALTNVFFVSADPDGALLNYLSNSTKGATTPDNRTDPGGYIHTMNINSTQQNTRWKAYVGNVSGSLTLDDASSNTIYDWALSIVTGEVFAARTSSITWANIDCATTSVIETADTAIGFSATADDNINLTFNETVHQSRVVAGQTITNSTCRSIATFTSDTRQAVSETADFQELLLDDNTNLVYAAILEDDTTGYDGSSTYDFQMIVPDNETTDNTQYFFFAELG